VYRFGGQRAFSHQIGSNSLDEKDEAHSVVSLEWKFNGRSLHFVNQDGDNNFDVLYASSPVPCMLPDKTRSMRHY
jgi:hypothetical protein